MVQSYSNGVRSSIQSRRFGRKFYVEDAALAKDKRLCAIAFQREMQLLPLVGCDAINTACVGKNGLFARLHLDTCH